jgi:hypothetical protein
VRSVSADFLAEVARPHHQMVSWAEVYLNGNRVLDYQPISAGRVSYDRQRKVRGSASVTFAQPVEIPTRQGGMFAPVGYELRLVRGVVFPPHRGRSVMTDYVLDEDGEYVTDANGTFIVGDPSVLAVARAARGSVVEAVSLGFFRIESSSIAGRLLSLEIEGLDRSHVLAEDALTGDWSSPAGATYGDIVNIFLDFSSVAWVPRNLNSLDGVTAVTQYEMQSSRLDGIERTATAAAAEFFVDYNGTFRSQSEPTIGSTPAVWEIVEGEGGRLIDINIELDRAPAYNAVIASGSNAENNAEYKGEAYDLNPSSVSYYHGPFGHKQRFYTSPLFTSNDQARRAAEAILDANLGIARTISVETTPNPALEPGDVIRLHRPAAKIESELAIIDAIDIGLGADQTMTIHIRSIPEN